MKIPIDENSLETNLDTQIPKELFDDHTKLEALSDDEFLEYVGEHIHKVVENPRDRLRLPNFLNKVDDILEKIIPQYQDLVSNTSEVLSTQKAQLDTIHGKLNHILIALFRVLINKANIGKFRSTEHLIKLVPICLDYSIIRKGLHILFSKFSNEELKKEEFTSLEPLLPRFCQNTYQLFQHYNLSSFYSKSLLEIFQDDPRYSTYIQHHEDGDKDSMRIVPEYTNELIFEAYKEKENTSSTNNQIDPQAIISVKIPNLQAKYPNQSHIMMCKKVNEEYNLNLKEDSPLWDALAFKIRACMSAASLSHRSHAISVAIDSLKLLVCFRKLFNLHKNLKKYNQYLPPVFDFTTFVMSSFKLFHLRLIPDLHESIITCVSSIMTMMDIEQDEFRDFSQQIVTQYQLFQKILKDCTTLQVETSEDGKHQLVTQPVLLPQETASNQDFLGCLLYLLHIGINQSFIDTESSLPTNQIYSITGIISSLINILKPPVGDHFLYNVESINITLDTFWIIIPHQNFINDLNIMDKLIDRALIDLELLLEPETKPFYHFVDDQWRVIKKSEHFEVVQGLLKLLDSPFEHQVNTRVQQAPTIARKMAEGNLVDVLKKVIAADVVNDSIFMAMLLLISDIARELPNAVEGFIDKGVIDVILLKLQKPFARDFPHLHLVIYFINMLGLNKRGFELERQYKIMEKLFDMFVDWNQAGNVLFNEVIADIAKELQELLKSVESYREPIADLMIGNLQKLAQIENSFFDSCLKKLKGENQAKIGYTLEETGEMEVEVKKSTTMEIAPSSSEENLLMSKEELQDFEKDLKRISMLIQTNCNIYSRILISEFKMRDVMHKKNSFEYLFKVLRFPLLPLADISPITWASSSFKHMANKLAGTDHDVQDRVYECLMKELQGVEELVGTLTECKDFSKVLSDEICYDARIHGLYHIINKYKSESIDMIYLMGRLSYSELLIDFLRYHDPIKINKDELFKLIDRLSDLYVLIINQIKREDMHFIKKNIEGIKTGREEMGEEKVKEVVEKCRITIMESHSSNRFTYHQTLRKFFKKILSQEIDYQCGDKYANISLKITQQLYVGELKLGDEETTDLTLAAVNTNNSVLAYLHEFFFSTNYRKFRNMPQFFFTFFQGNGFHRIIETLNQLRLFTENYGQNFQEESSIASLEKIKLVLMKESLSQNYQKLSLIMKMILLLPIELRMDAKLNGKLEPHTDVKLEYFYGACKDIIDRFFNVFTGFSKTFECFYLYHIRRKIARQKRRTAEKNKPVEEQKDNKEGVDTFYENLGTLIETSFESLRKIQELYKGPAEEGLDDRGNREQAEGLIQTLVSMGFPRDRAELAARNAEYLDVEPALMWLENYDATQTNGQEEAGGQPMEEEGGAAQALTKEKEGETSVESIPKENIEKNDAPREFKKITKEQFQKDVVLQALQDLSKHIIANIFFFEGYDGRVLEIIQASLETQEGDAKKMMTQEIAVMVFKLLKHNINNFTKGVKFISKFKVSKSFEKSITFTKESLHKMGSQKVSLLHKIRAINNILPWFNHFLSFIPNIEKNLLKSDFVTELLRFFEQMLREVDEAKESGDDQEMLYEIANTLTSKFFHTLFVILKLRNTLDETKRAEAKKDSRTPKKDGTAVQPKEASSIQVENQNLLKELKPADKKPSAVKEGEQGTAGQEAPKKGLMELMICILNQAEQFSLKQKRSIIFFQSSLCVYMKVLNLLLQNNQENCKTFIEKKGLQELIKYKLDTREPKGSEFLKEFGEICLNLMAEPALELVSLECSIKNFFYHLSTEKVNLRVFTEHFKEQLQKDSEGFMGLVKELCQIEDKESRKESLHKSKSTLSLGGAEPKSSGEAGGEPQLTRAEERKESPSRQNTLTRRKKTEDTPRSKMISLKPEIEYSRLYSLSYLAKIGEDVKVHQESHQRKKRKKSGNKPDEQKDEDTPTHVLDFMPPTNTMHVIHTLMDNLVLQFNLEVNGETEKQPNATEPQFHALFSYSFFIVTFQIILQKHPILNQNILRQNVTRTCKNTLKNTAAARNIDLNRNISFLSYFLRVIVFSTMDLFKNFLLSICSNTSLIVDKDRSGNPYVTPYFFDLKKKILSEIYQILDEGVNLKPFYKTKDDSRLFCSISTLFFYLLPLKDIARLVYDNAQQFNFLKVYSEALKQLKVGNYEHLEKLNVFISEPLGVLIQYHHYFALSKEGTELKTIPGDLFMPKKSLTANSHFVDDWKKMINPALKGNDFGHGGGSRFLRLPVEDDDDGEMDELLEMDEMEEGDLLNDEEIGSDLDGEDGDLDEQGEHDDDLIEREEGEDEGIMQIERERSEDDEGGFSGESGSDEWTDIEEDYSDDDEDDMENEDDDDEDDDDDHDEDDMFDDDGEGQEIIIQEVDDDDDGNTDEEDDGDDDDDLDEDDISEESFIDFDASDEEDEGGRDPFNIQGFLNGNSLSHSSFNLPGNAGGGSRRNQHEGQFGGGGAANTALSNLVNVPHSTHPEIQRIASLIQANSARFDAEGARNVEDSASAPETTTTQIQIIGRQRNQGLEIVQQQEAQPAELGAERAQANNEPRTVFDRIHDEIAYLQSSQYLQDNRRSAEFNENFFEDIRQNNPAAAEEGEDGIRVIRGIRNIFDGAAGGGRNNFLNIFSQVLAPLEGRRDRSRPHNLFEGSEFMPVFGNSGGATFRIHTSHLGGLQVRDGSRAQNAHHGAAHNQNRAQNDNEDIEDFESQLLEQLAPAAPRAAQREERQPGNEEPNPFEELRSRPEDEAQPEVAAVPENNNSRRRQGRRSNSRRQEETQIEEEKEETKQQQETPVKPQEETKNSQESATKKPEPTTQAAAAESSINFEAFGLAPDFLEKNGIDPVFFNELDDELKYEVMAQYMNKPPAREAARRTPATQPTAQSQPQPQTQAQPQISADFMSALNAAMNLTIPNNQTQPTPTDSASTRPPANASNLNLQSLVNNLTNSFAGFLGGNTSAQSQPAATTENQSSAADNNDAQGQPQPQPQGQGQDTYNENLNEALDNAAFIASLAPDLREEILATAEPAFLASLPPEMVMEAEALRARHGMMRMNPLAARGDTFMLDDNDNGGAEAAGLSIHDLTNRIRRQQDPHHGTHVRKIRNYFKEALSKDKTLGSKLYMPDEKTLEAILKLMYMSEESFERFPYNVMKSLMLHPQTEYKVLDCLLFLLKNPDLGEKLDEDIFPCKVIYEKNSIEKNYRVVYEKISLKILFLLEQLTRNEPLSYFVQEEGVISKKDKKRSLQSLNNIKGAGNKEGGNSPMLELIRLLSRPGISNSATHMKLMLNNLNNITRHLKTTTSKPKEIEENAMKTEEPKDPKEQQLTKASGELEASRFKLDRELVSRLCACLTNPTLEEDSLYKLSNIICIFCTDKQNFTLFMDEFKLFINKFSEDANKMLADKMKILKKVISDPNENANDMTIVQEKDLLVNSWNKRSTREKEQLLMNLLNRLDAETDYEIQLNKILKLIKELFEKSLIEFGKRELSQDQKDITTNKDSDAIDTQAREKVKDQFRGLFEDGQLQALWLNITEFLSSLNEIFANNWAILSPISHKLQPVLESFFIIYKILNDDEAYEIYRKGKTVRLRESRKPVNFGISRLVSEGEVHNHPGLLEDSFQRLRQTKLDSNDMLNLMCEKNKNILNMMVKQNPHLLSDSLSIVVKKMPKVLDFENKRSYFKNELKKIKRGYYSSVRLQVSRANLFIESFNQIMQRKPHEMRGKLNIEFYDEEGVDAGGVTREWFLALSKEILNPNYALFKPAAHGSAFQPSPQSNINPDHLKFFKFVGRIIGKALHDGYMLDCYFTRSFYKHILGQPLTYHDIEDIDPEYYRNLTWILENDVTGLDLPFSYEAEEFGVVIVRDLVPDGRNIVVTEENKRDYVQRICYAKMANDIKEQIEAFLQGFHEVIPPHLIQIFDNKELELMISGLPDIDIPDLKDNTEYHNYTRETEVIRWFWEILEDLDRTHKASFLQFVTGTSKVPIGGFKDLVGMGGALQKFQIHKSFDINKLPTSHTCFNQLDLPEYKTKETLKEKLMIAITEGKEGFGFV